MSWRLPVSAKGGLLFFLAAVLSLPSAAAPEAGIKPIPPSEYAARRQALAESLRAELAPGELGILLIRSLPEPENATFRQDSNLYYLAGIEVPRSALVLAFDRTDSALAATSPGASPNYAEYLYLPASNPRQEKWTGPRLSAGGLEKESLGPDPERQTAMRLTGFDRIPEGDFPPRRWPRGPVESIGDLPEHLSVFLSRAGVLFFAAEPGILGEPLSESMAFQNELRARYPELKLKDPRAALGRLRMIKSASEIEQLRRAVEITCQAVQDASRVAAAGAAEYQVQAELERRFILEGARRPGFPSIIASGPNSCILHYDASERVLAKGDLLLMDVGAEYRRYSADISRTLPVGGRFSKEQRKIYDLVYQAQEAALAVAKPGVAFAELDKAARKVIADAGYGPYFIHATSHFLGLDVHDDGDTSAVLRPGMVFTIEPGIYLPDKQLGVRIEDDILVTATGAEILSRCLPRRADAVEMQMGKGLTPGTR
ncbi:MAG TPA: Xaa-Pro peptidase family protein [Candidatus Polarisedimenticolia bacterium]|nr:Xaa-Pro peptidase family protein [Candidatus Polarisedimenticolia bacterium]